MTPDAALVKLMHALANESGPEGTARYLPSAVAGERS